MDIDEPLKPVPFKRLGLGFEVPGFIYEKATIAGVLHNKHLYSRAADRRWNKALKEDDTEPEHDIPGEEVPSSAE